MLDINGISIKIEIEPFSCLNTLNIAGRTHYNISDIADIRGTFVANICGQEIINDSPVLNLVEMNEFLYGLVIKSDNSIPLTIDMEPVFYGWREGQEALITSFKYKEQEVNGQQNILGKIASSDVAAFLQDALQEAWKIARSDPFLYMYIVGRMYRQPAAHGAHTTQDKRTGSSTG